MIEAARGAFSLKWHLPLMLELGRHTGRAAGVHIAVCAPHPAKHINALHAGRQVAKAGLVMTIASNVLQAPRSKRTAAWHAKSHSAAMQAIATQQAM